MQIRLFISPFFLHRFYLRKNIREIVKKYSFSGSLIDIGCGSKPHKDLFPNVEAYKGIDFGQYSRNKDFKGEEPDYFFDKEYSRTLTLPFKNDSFDNVVAFQVLEHHKDPKRMISEIIRVVRKGGNIMLSFPFIGGLHEEPYDYQRLTEYGLEELLRPYKCEVLSIKKQGSIFSVISMLLNEYINGFAAKSKLHYKVSILFYPPFLAFSYLCLFGDMIFKSKRIFISYLVFIKKL